MKDITEELNLIEEQISEPIPEPAPEPLMSVEDFVELSATLLVTIRKVPPEAQAEWIRKYKSFNITLLKLISFDKAIGLMQLSNMKPETSLIVGLGILVGSAFFIKVPNEKTEFKPSETKKITEKKKVDNPEIREIINKMKEDDAI